MTAIPESPSPEALAGLSLALRFPEGLPLHASRARPGYFPATAVGKRLAQQCRAAGWLAPVGPDGKQQRHALTPAGHQALAAAADPLPLLRQLLAAVADRQAELAEATTALRSCEARLAQVAERIHALLPQVTAARVRLDAAPPPARQAPERLAMECLTTDLLARLTLWRSERPHADCPLPELFATLRRHHPELTLGAFHDLVRRLHQEGALTLQPWTGPLSELPDPASALMVGHAVMAYAAAAPEPSSTVALAPAA